MYVCRYACLWGEVVHIHMPQVFPTFSWKQVLSLTWNSTKKAWIASYHWVPGYTLSAFHLTSTGTTGVPHWAWLLTHILGIWTEVIMLVRQALCPRCHLLSSLSSFSLCKWKHENLCCTFLLPCPPNINAAHAASSILLVSLPHASGISRSVCPVATSFVTWLPACLYGRTSLLNQVSTERHLGCTYVGVS